MPTIIHSRLKAAATSKGNIQIIVEKKEFRVDLPQTWQFSPAPICSNQEPYVPNIELHTEDTKAYLHKGHRRKSSYTFEPSGT